MYQYRGPVRPSKPKTPKLLYITLAVVLLASAGVIINYIYRDYMFRHGSAPVIEYEPEPIVYIPTPSPTPSPTPEPTPEPEPSPEPSPEPTPDPGPTPPPRVMRQEFLDHRAHYNNDNIIGHLWIPNTTINYLVTQTDNNVFYLYHDIWGRRSAPGWIFLDYLADISGQEQNLVVYGHNMRRDHMFHSVRRFRNRDFFFNNRYIFFSTIYVDYVFEIFSVYSTHISFPHIYPNYDDREGGWDYWINAFAARSMFDAGITVTGEDRVLTLSTCDPIGRDYRIALHAVLISETYPHLDDINTGDYGGHTPNGQAQDENGADGDD